MLTISNGSAYQEQAENFSSEVPQPEKRNTSFSENLPERGKELVKIIEEPLEKVEENQDREQRKKNEFIPPEKVNDEKNNNLQQQTSEKKTQSEVRKLKTDKHLNQETDNTNILCLGIADNQLEMISIYSINKSNKKSAGIFLPTKISIKVNNELLTLRQVYSKYGIKNLKKILAQCLEVNIPYHMVVDKQGLIELSELIGPLYVENENIDIPNLFVKPVSEKDDLILQSLAKKITQPKMVLQMPKLIKIFINNVQSDIGISGLWDLYDVFKNLNHSQLTKIVLWGEKIQMAGKEYRFIDPYDWHNVVYEMTN